MNFSIRTKLAYIASLLPIILYCKWDILRLQKAYGNDLPISEFIEFKIPIAISIVFLILSFLANKTAKYFVGIYNENQERFNSLSIKHEQNEQIKCLLFDISLFTTPIGCFIFMIILKLIRVFGFDNLKYPKIHENNNLNLLLFITFLFWLPNLYNITIFTCFEPLHLFFWSHSEIGVKMGIIQLLLATKI